MHKPPVFEVNSYVCHGNLNVFSVSGRHLLGLRFCWKKQQHNLFLVQYTTSKAQYALGFLSEWKDPDSHHLPLGETGECQGPWAFTSCFMSLMLKPLLILKNCCLIKLIQFWIPYVISFYITVAYIWQLLVPTKQKCEVNGTNLKIHVWYNWLAWTDSIRKSIIT